MTSTSTTARKAGAAAGLLALTLGLAAGCSKAEPAAPSSSTATGTAHPAPAAPSPSPEPVHSETVTAPDPSDTSLDTVPFGSTWAYPDGLAVTVSKPSKYARSGSAYGGEKAAVLGRFTVKVTNGTDQRYDPTGVYITAASDGVEGEQVFDSAKGLGGAPSTSVAPGKSVTFDVVFGLKALTDVTMEVTPEFSIDRDPAIFEG